MADTVSYRTGSPKRTCIETKVRMETPWRTFGSAHPGDQAVGAAGNARRGSTWKAYAEESYVKEPRRSRLDFEEEMDVAAVGTHGGRRWEPRSAL